MSVSKVKITSAPHPVGRARKGILQYVQNEHEQDASLAGSAEAK
jgi:hypothetical protein